MVPTTTSLDISGTAFQETTGLATGKTVAACDICGTAFISRWPALVVVKMPKGRESEVVNLCDECERHILQELEPRIGG